MAQIKIGKSKFEGRFTAPPSKSVTHRALIAGALSGGSVKINNMLISDDTTATVKALSALGYGVNISDNRAVFTGIYKPNPDKNILIPCDESGTTLRLLIPVVLTMEEKNYIFFGKESLFKRPLDDYFKIFDAHGIKYRLESDSLLVKGQLKPGQYSLKGGLSSQFVSGLLFALSRLGGDSEITIDDSVSRGYIDLTIDMLKKFGIRILKHGFGESGQAFLVPGGVSYKPQNITVEGDYSSAAAFLCSAALEGSITVSGLEEASHQGDKKIIDILKSMGANIRISENSVRIKESKLSGTEIDAEDIPDLVPYLTVLATMIEGRTVIKGVDRLKYKESDRIAAVEDNLRNLGIDIHHGIDKLIIDGSKDRLLRPSLPINPYGDHRILMALSIFSTRLYDDGILSIDGMECVNKSYPEFFKDFKKLGGTIYE